MFLAGSIEMGKAVDWQSAVVELLKDELITIFNPRRDDWDSSWKQQQHNPQFNRQVNWEMNRMLEASIIFMNILPNTKSPVSLLELGMHANHHNIIVCCPEGFWRKGNVDIVCARHNIPCYADAQEATGALLTKVMQELGLHW